MFRFTLPGTFLTKFKKERKKESWFRAISAPIVTTLNYHLRVFQVQMTYFDEIEKHQYVLFIAPERETVVILSSFRVRIPKGRFHGLIWCMIDFSVIEIHNFINDLVQKCKKQRELAFVLETLLFKVIMVRI